MRAFKFTLEAVRTVRLRLEQTAQEHYAQALLARDNAKKLLEAIEQESRSIGDQMREKFKRVSNARELEQNSEYQALINDRRNQAIQTLGTAERRVNAALQNMLAARQQREIVDKFLANQQEVHARKMGREEQAAMDELAGRGHASLLTRKHAEALL